MGSLAESLKKYKTTTETLCNKVFIYVSLVLYIIMSLELMFKTPVYFLDTLAFIVCASFIFNPLFAVPPLILSSSFFDAFYMFEKIPYSAVLAFALIIGIILSLVRTKRKPNYKYLLLCGAIIIYAFFNSLFGLTQKLDYVFILALNVFLIYFLANFLTSRTTLKLVLRCFFILTVILVAVCGLIYIFGLGFYREGHFTLYSNFYGINSEYCLNPNNFAKGLEQCCAILIAGIFLTKKTSYKIFLALFIVLAIFLSFMSGSRTGFLTIGLGLIAVSLLSGIYSERSSRKADCFILIVIFAAAALVYIIMTAMKLDVISRFSVDSVVQSGGTGRSYIWEVMLTKIIPEHMWFGVGCGENNILEAMSIYSQYPNYAHNIIFSLLGQYGIIGASLLVTPFALIMDKLILGRKNIKFVLLPLSLIFFALINGFGESMLDLWGLWVSIGFGLFLYNMNKSPESVIIPERKILEKFV